MRDEEKTRDQLFRDIKTLRKKLDRLERSLADQKRTVKTYRDSEERFHALAQNSTDIITIIDQKGTIQYVSPSIRRILGYTPEESTGRSVFANVHPEDIGAMKQCFSKVMSEPETPLSIECRFRNRDGFWIYLESICCNLIKNRRIRGVVLNSRDITERKFALKRLELANRHKDEFLANMSHELRTPLTSIMGGAQLLFSERSRGRERKLSEVIYRNGQHLLRLVNDILDLTRVESGRLEIRSASHSILDIVLEEQKAISSIGEKAGVVIQVQLCKDVVVWVDSTRVLQILHNLLINAVKFTPPGGRVTIGWKRLNGYCEVWVKDTGIGIPPDEQHKVFSRFEKVETETLHDDMPKGMGLGLAVARSLVELQGGSIYFESEEGKGTTFRFTLPVKPAGAPFRTTQTIAPSGDGIPLPPIAKTRVLLIEDDAGIRQVLLSFLKSENAIPSAEDTGAGGLRAARKTMPDVILLDMKLPDMSGYAVISKLLKDEKTRSIPIIALTALTMSGDREKCLTAGCADYVSKPVNFNLLRNSIARVLPKSGRRQGSVLPA
jgi:PAS domain S-box-containing protein